MIIFSSKFYSSLEKVVIVCSYAYLSLCFIFPWTAFHNKSISKKSFYCDSGIYYEMQIFKEKWWCWNQIWNLLWECFNNFLSIWRKYFQLFELNFYCADAKVSVKLSFMTEISEKFPCLCYFVIKNVFSRQYCRF